MPTTGFISADSHVNEPVAAWEAIPEGLRERGPHFIQDPPGKKGLYICFEGHDPDPGACGLPTIEDGVRGVEFIEAAVESRARGGVWADARMSI